MLKGDDVYPKPSDACPLNAKGEATVLPLPPPRGRVANAVSRERGRRVRKGLSLDEGRHVLSRRAPLSRPGLPARPPSPAEGGGTTRSSHPPVPMSDITLQGFMAQLTVGLIGGCFYAMLSMGLAIIFDS